PAAGRQAARSRDAVACLCRDGIGRSPSSSLRSGQDCCRNSCCTPSEVRLATLEVSCDWNRNWWHCIVISSICPGVISVALADIARDRFSILVAVPLRLSKALTIVLAVDDSPGGAVLVTALASLPAGAAPP